jgi:hypothetical protein
MDPEIAAAWIGAAATLVAAGLAAAIIMIQIGRQSRDATEQTRETERLTLKLSIYREILAICQEQAEAERKLSLKLGILRYGTLPVWREPERFGGIRPKAPTDSMELTRLVGEALNSGNAVVTLTEQWRIVDSRLDLFSHAVSAAIHDIRGTWDNLHSKLATLLPPMRPGPDSPLPGPDKILAAENGCAAMIDGLATLSLRVTDFQREMQNLLLSELFDHTVPPRDPADPGQFAVTLSKYESQKAYFETESEWGRSRSKADRHVDPVSSPAVAGDRSRRSRSMDHP